MANDPPAPFPPPPPREPFLRLRTPREGTLLGLQTPPPPAAPAPLGGAPAAAPGALPAELERKLDELTRELGSFRALIVRAARAAAPPPAVVVAAPAPRRPSPRGRRRELQRQALVALAGGALALSVAFASAAVALAVPGYARFVARAARLGAPAPAATWRLESGGMRSAQAEQSPARAQ